jgi:hypothetical protein
MIYQGSNNEEPITIETVKQLCANIPFTKFDTYIELLQQKKLLDAIHLLFSIHDFGYSVIDILDIFYHYLKQTSQKLQETELYEIVQIICKYITIYHKVREDHIELALFAKECMNCIKLNIE